jgi:hypothetical protein
MEHIAEAVERLDHIMVSIEHLADRDIVEEVARARDELLQARRTGAEVLLELLNLAERHALMQDELEEFRRRVH